MKIKPGFVRIIAGEWRGRRLKVLKAKGLRPTPDRVRETVFNWLSPYLPNAHCLDLFAGSGAFGFEALSRGARDLVMVDEDQEVVQLLKEEIVLLGAKHAEVYQARIPSQWPHFMRTFDIVFLDPPYHAELLLLTCHDLEEKKFLTESALIYLEAKAVIKDNDLPKNWRLIKKACAGQVFFHLALREK